MSVAQVDRLQQTIDTLLNVARDRPHPSAGCELAARLAAAEQRWRGPLAAGATPGRGASRGSGPGRSQPGCRGLEVLLHNAATHGGGNVTVALRTVDDRWVAVDVADEGPGFAGDPELAFRRRAAPSGGEEGHGIGLALARSLAHADGGRLTVTDAGPAPRITLLLRRDGAGA